MARRISKSAIDWAKFIQLLPKDEMPHLAALRSKNDNYVRIVNELPESMPAIDFSYYKSRIANPKIAEEFEQKYKAFKVPYPEDKYSAKVDVQAQQGKAHVENFIQESKKRVEGFKQELERYNNIIPIQHMTMDDHYDMFPEEAFNPDKPTFFPHDPETQRLIKEGEEEDAAGLHDHDH